MTIRRQMIMRIALPTLIIYLVVVGLTVAYVYRESRAAVDRDMTRLALNYAARFDGHLREAARIAETSAAWIASVQEVADDEIYEVLTRNVAQTSLVYGSCMAFEPGVRKTGVKLFAPYVCRAAEGFRRMDIDDSVYDWYRDPRYTWFSRPKSLGVGVWSEPYFDEGAGNVLMSTYSAPFRLRESFGGVNTVDLHLSRLHQTVGAGFDRDLDFVILTADGQFVFDPDSSRIMSKTLFQLAEETGNAPLAALGQEMLKGVPGVGTIDRWDGRPRQLVFYAPIRSTKWVFACRVPESAVLADVRARVGWSAAALALTLVLIIGCIGLVAQRIARPVARLRDKVLEVAGGNLDARIEDEPRAEELQDLAQSFNRMTAHLRAQVERLAEETAARQRIVRDLDIARGIQRDLLPVNRPHVSGYEIVGWSQPADQTGGDYYDWQTLPSGRTIITLADVSGHGIGPALVTAVCRAYARASFATLQELATVIEQLNDLLAADLQSGRFVTFVAVMLNAQNNQAEVISAGHGPILHYIAAEQRIVEIAPANLPLGIQGAISYGPTVQCTFSRGDILILMTDGLFEWANSQGELFGIQRLEETFLGLVHLSSEEIIKALYGCVRAFAGETPQLDDVTAVVVKRIAE